MVPISNNFFEHLRYVKVEQAAPAPLQRDALPPLGHMGPHHPEGLGLEAADHLMPLHTKVEGGSLAGAIRNH